MQLVAIFFAVFALLAGQVYSLDISIGASLSPVPADQFLNVSDAGIQAACNNGDQSDCGLAQSAIAKCAADDDACLCNNETVKQITACEQCMFAELIRANRPMPDPRAGNQVALTGYITACTTANQIVDATLGKLALPDNWDGPFGQGLNTATTAIVLIVTLGLGLFCIGVTNTM